MFRQLCGSTCRMFELLMDECVPCVLFCFVISGLDNAFCSRVYALVDAVCFVF